MFHLKVFMNNFAKVQILVIVRLVEKQMEEFLVVASCFCKKGVTNIDENARLEM